MNRKGYFNNFEVAFFLTTYLNDKYLISLRHLFGYVQHDERIVDSHFDYSYKLKKLTT